jgi:hypothetical protein
VDYNPFKPSVQFNPYPIYRWMRDEAPVIHQPEAGF